MKKLLVKYLIAALLLIGCFGGANKAFGQTVTITGANSTNTNGITAGSIVRGQTNVVLFGFKVAVASGTVNFTAFTLNGGTGGLFTNGRLYKTPAHGSTFASATIVSGASVSIVNNNPQITSINESINNNDYTYFVVADLIPSYGSLPATVQYSFSQANWSYNASFSGVSFSCINPTVTFAPNTTGLNASSSLYYGQTNVVLMGVDVTSTGAATVTNAFLYFSTTTANPFLYFPAANIEIWRSTSGSFATASKVTATINQAPNTITADLGGNVTINAGTTYTYYLVASFTGSTTGLPSSFKFDLTKIFSNNGGTTYTNASGTTGATYTLTSGSATFTNNNFTSSGITGGNISYGQTSIVLFSFGITMQANATISSMYIPCTTNMGQYLNNTTAKLYRSTTANFVNATVVSGASFNYNGGVSGVPITGLSEAFTAASPATYYYFIVADLNATASFPTPLTFNFSLSSGQSTAALTATNGSTYNSGSTITGQSFSIVTTYDWVGTYGSSWTDKRNFNPFNSGADVTTLPDATITVLVGVNKAFTTAPIIPGTTIGGLSIKNATVTLTGGTITVVKNLNISGTTSTITGANDLAVGGDLINPSGSTLQLTGTGAASIGGMTTNSGTITKSSTGNTTFTGIVTNTSTGIINQSATSGTMTFGAATGQANLGTINQTSGGSISFSGALDNSGSIIQSNTGTGTLDVTGVFTNSGTLTKSGTGPVTVNGIFTNASTGVVTIGSGALILNATTPSNAGAITSAGSLDINGSTSFTNSGTINITGGAATIASPVFSNTSAGIFTSAGTVNFDGAVAQAINNNNTSTAVSFYYLVLSGGAFTKTLGGTGKFKIASTGSIEFTTTNTVLAAGTAILTLSSDANGSSTVKSLLAGNSITGTVNVERYLTGGDSNSRGYRLLSSPVSVSSSSLILPNLSYIKNAAYISGTGGPTNGFDVSGNPTLYFYRENLKPSSANFTAGNFRGVSSINAGSTFTINNDPGTFSLPAGNGFLFFFRGNRATNASTSITAIADPVTLTSTGYLNQGDITVNHWTGAAANGKLLYTNTSGNNLVRGYNLVGNPYASSIDWDKVNSKHVGGDIGSIIYIYNPKLKVYATYIAGLGGVGINFTGPQANIIPTGQGFFVIAQNQNASITFSEDDKVPSQLTASDLSLASAADSLEVQRYLRVQLFKDSLNKEDAIVFFKNNAQTNYNVGEDAQYLKGNSIVNISTRSSDNVSLAINQQAFPQKRQIIPLNVNITSNGSYKLGIPDVKNIPNMYDVWLLDNYKKDSLDIKHNPNYSFIASVTDTNSFGSKRFSLVLRPNPALTVHLLSFTGTKTATQVKLAWKAENESSYTRYILERSIDGGKKFNTLDSLTSANLGVYNDLDPNPVKGQNLYRLKQIDLTGNISYSSIVPVMYADNVVNNITANLISVYPNPVKSMLNLAITPATTTAANYKITITNTTGSVIRSSTSSNPTWQGDVSILSPGTYFIEVTNIASNTVTGKSTFIKL
ncbi:T9SS type A sorting domain-containing protein [Mucilaginibacter sp. UYCu711]|uniref:T9SS type A sorting domain-containing protein n=1 Tax=Mucilaginibacter sp. UYCu711 TaxID=3156339 RepID=UPI003D1DA357